MSPTLSAKDAAYRADCTACEWSRTRALDDGGENVSADDNQDILERLARNHEHTCPASGDGWSETVDVETDLDMDGGA